MRDIEEIYIFHRGRNPRWRVEDTRSEWEMMLDRGEDQNPAPIEFYFHDVRVYYTRYPGPDARHMLTICSTAVEEQLHENFFSVGRTTIRTFWYPTEKRVERSSNLRSFTNWRKDRKIKEKQTGLEKGPKKILKVQESKLLCFDQDYLAEVKKVVEDLCYIDLPRPPHPWGGIE